MNAAMTLDFATWQRGSEQYANVDAELTIRLTTLYFFCNRPTLGALMGIGEDISDALSTSDSSQATDPAAIDERDEESPTDTDSKSTTDESQGIVSLILRLGTRYDLAFL